MDEPIVQLSDEQLSVGQRLRQARHEKGWSISEAANEHVQRGHHLTTGALGTYERGDREITVSRLLELAELYDADAGWLLTGRTTMPEADDVTRVALKLAKEAKRMLAKGPTAA